MLLGNVTKVSKIFYLRKLYSGRIYFYDTVWAMKVDCKVSRVYKGQIHSKKKFTFITGLGHGDCGFNFNIDQDYLIYAYAKKNFMPSKYLKGYLYTDVCTRTCEYSKEERDKLEYFTALRRCKQR